MTDDSYRHYVLIIDRSGSMVATRADAQEGVRFFTRDQATLPGRATMTLVQFDDDYEVVHDFAPLSAAESYALVPRNMTALLDACGKAITSTGERLAALPEHERPGKVIVLITTDGQENASHEYTRQQVRDLITQQQRDYGWQFSYVGANVDAFAEAGGLGIARGSTLSYASTSRGTQSSYSAASASTRRYVSGQSANVSYTDEERDAAADEDEKIPDGDD